MSGTLARWGLRLDLPHGWDARLLRRRPTSRAETGHPLLHAANLRLPVAPRGDYGSDTVARLGGGHLLLVVKEFHPDLAGRPLYRHPIPWPLTPAMVNPRGLQRTLPGQSGFQRFFSHQGRAFCLYVVLGAHTNRAVLLARANHVLAGLAIDPHHQSHIAHFTEATR